MAPSEPLKGNSEKDATLSYKLHCYTSIFNITYSTTSSISGRGERERKVIYYMYIYSFVLISLGIRFKALLRAILLIKWLGRRGLRETKRTLLLDQSQSALTVYSQALLFKDKPRGINIDQKYIL